MPYNGPAPDGPKPLASPAPPPAKFPIQEWFSRQTSHQERDTQIKAMSEESGFKSLELVASRLRGTADEIARRLDHARFCKSPLSETLKSITGVLRNGTGQAWGELESAQARVIEQLKLMEYLLIERQDIKIDSKVLMDDGKTGVIIGELECGSRVVRYDTPDPCGPFVCAVSPERLRFVDASKKVI